MAGGLNRRQSAGAGGVTSLSRRECQGMFQCTPTETTKYEEWWLVLSILLLRVRSRSW